MRFYLLLPIVLWVLLTGCATVIDSAISEPISDDRGDRTTGQIVDDKKAQLAIAVNIKKASSELKSSNITIRVYNGVVLMAGQVPSEGARKTAVAVARQYRGVNRVINQLEIAGSATVLTEISDLTVSAQIKVLVGQKLGSEIYKRTIITTESGIVYLMGFVTRTEAVALENVVSEVRGVKRTVLAFEYID